MALNLSDQLLSATSLADIMGVSRATLKTWVSKGYCLPLLNREGEKTLFCMQDLLHLPPVKAMAESRWAEEMQTRPMRAYTSLELFAGAGGLALGMEWAGFEHILLNEIDRDAVNTLRHNRPNWQVIHSDIREVNFEAYRGQVDLLTGGFPCQAFSYAGKQGGFEDTRGTLFFELARAINEVRPRIFMAENVRGLQAHDGGRTLYTIRKAIQDLGYTLVEPQVLKAILYQVPQKRERLILIGIRNDLAHRVTYQWPEPYHRIMTLRDAFYAGDLYDTDVPHSLGQKYPPKKKQIMDLVPEGGCWRDLPTDVQRDYMGGSFDLSGGKTGLARRLAMDEPSLTLTCAPAQKQTERCHPTETRPLTVREYARIQTFPDEWVFKGSLTAQYKQIGNAVPVNLAYAIGRSLVRLLNQLEHNN